MLAKFVQIVTNMTERALVTSFAILTKNFELSFDAEVISEEYLLQKLTQHINYLLDRDFQQLLNVLYRIDVNEHQFKNIITYSQPEDLAEDIAKLVFARVKQKAEIRLKYS